MNKNYRSLFIEHDYYPFGMVMPERNFNSTSYDFGFNGQMKTDEISGTGNHNTALFWEYDTRLGRRWNIDPVIKPGESSYATFGGNPILMVDPSGDDWFKNHKTGDVIYNDTRGSVGTVVSLNNHQGSDEDNEYTNIGEYYAKYNEQSNKADLYKQNSIIASGRMPKTFKGFENSKYQSWDALIAGFSALYKANPDFVKSIIIQEVGFTAGKGAWVNDPMQMFHPGDYSSQKNIGTKEDVRSRFKEKDINTKFGNGILSINSGTQWLYGEKFLLSNSTANIPEWLKGAFSSYPSTFRMAFRYNGSYTLLNTSCDGNFLERAFIYATRVHNRANFGEKSFVPTGTQQFDFSEIK